VALSESRSGQGWPLDQFPPHGPAGRASGQAFSRRSHPPPWGAGEAHHDGSEANAAVIRRYHDEHGRAIIIVQVKYLNHLVEQDPRGVKRPTRPMLGLKSSEAAQGILVGIALMHRLRNGQLECGSDQGLTPAAPFYSLAASSPAQLASRDPR